MNYQQKKLDKLQKQALQYVQKQIDVESIDKNQIRDAKAKRRALQRLANTDKKIIDQEAEVNEAKLFQKDLKSAMKKHSKHSFSMRRFNDDGVQFEPFNMKTQFRSNQIDSQGNLLIQRRKNDQDAWLLSVQDTIKQLSMKESEQQRQKELKMRSTNIGKNDNSQDVQNDQSSQQELQDKQGEQSLQDDKDSDGFKKPQDLKQTKKIEFYKYKISENMKQKEKLSKYLTRLKKQKNKEQLQKIVQFISQITSEDPISGAQIYSENKEDLAFDYEQQLTLRDRRGSDKLSQQ